MTSRIIDLKQLKKTAEAPEQKSDMAKKTPPKKMLQKNALIQKSMEEVRNELPEKPQKKEEFRMRPEAETFLDRPGSKFLFKLAEKGKRQELPAVEEEPKDDTVLAGGFEDSVSRAEDRPKKTRREQAKKEEPEFETVYESSDETALLSWRSLEYIQPENGKERAILAGILAAGFFIGSLIIKNYLLAIIIGLAYSIIYIYSVRKPLMIDFALTRRGIQVGNRVYEYDNLKSFWVFYAPPELKELSVQSKKTLMPYIKIPIENVNPTQLRSILLKYIPEKKQEESVVDVAARRIGF